MKLRAYQNQDEAEFERLFIDTFSASEGHDEGQSIGKLVHNLLNDTDNSDLYAFTAEEDEKLIGGIIFTRLSFQNETTAFILSPVAVHPDHQGLGVGQALISHGLAFLSSQRVSLVFTYGDPSYYSQVGFQHISEALIRAPQKMSMPQGWLCQSLQDEAIEAIKGPSSCVPALNKSEYW